MASHLDAAQEISLYKCNIIRSSNIMIWSMMFAEIFICFDIKNISICLHHWINTVVSTKRMVYNLWKIWSSEWGWDHMYNIQLLFAKHYNSECIPRNPRAYDAGIMIPSLYQDRFHAKTNPYETHSEEGSILLKCQLFFTVGQSGISGFECVLKQFSCTTFQVA